jgi:hypothetical protein
MEDGEAVSSETAESVAVSVICGGGVAESVVGVAESVVGVVESVVGEVVKPIVGGSCGGGGLVDGGRSSTAV